MKILLSKLLYWIALFTSCIATNAIAEEQPWAGNWHVTWPAGGGNVQLEQEGKAVQGVYRHGRGRMEATADGLRLEGNILIGGSTLNFNAQLSADQMSFSGHTDAGGWLNGLRIRGEDTAEKGLSVDLQNPRAAMASFLAAGNRARAGETSAFALAANAVHFGNEQMESSEQARIENTRSLFNLIDLATFSLSSIPNNVSETSFSVSLPRLDSKSKVDLDFVRSSDGSWRIAMPTAETLNAMDQTSSPRTADGFQQLQSPRDTMRSFLHGMSHWQKGGDVEAVETLELSGVPEVIMASEGQIAANYLVRIIDRVGLLPLQSLPNSGIAREPFVYYSQPAGQIVIEPYGTGNDTRWRFSSDTVAGLRRLYRAIETLPEYHNLDSNLIPYSQMFVVRDLVKANAPTLLNNVPRSDRVEYWQVIGALIILTLTVLLAAIISRSVIYVAKLPRAQSHFSNPSRMAWALGFGLAFLVGLQFVEYMGLTTARWPYFAPVIGTLILFALSYAAWTLIHVLYSLLQQYSQRSDTPLDSIMVTFGAGMIRLLLLGGTGLALGSLWSVPTTGLLAGLGMGGLAIAFASKETLSNVFGAGILLTDRPFQTGDRIIAGDINGWVEAVSLRSTRIRMLDDSIIIVPNGKLADMSIINRGARRRQVLSTTLLVTSGGSPERLEALTEDIRRRLLSDPIFVAHDVEVNIAGLDRHGIKVEIFSSVNTRSGPEYRKATHQFLLDIISMASARQLTLGRGTETQARSITEED